MIVYNFYSHLLLLFKSKSLFVKKTEQHLRRGVDGFDPSLLLGITATLHPSTRVLFVYNLSLNCNLSAGSVAPCKNFGGLVIHAKNHPIPYPHVIGCPMGNLTFSFV
jgi:hypothetical protein